MVYIFFIRYNKEISTTPSRDDRNNDKVLAEFVALSAVKQYIDSCEEQAFLLLVLENIYLEKMMELGYLYKRHSTRFARKLEDTDVGVKVVQKDQTCEYIAVKKERLKSVLAGAEWIALLKQVVKPIRQEILETLEPGFPATSDLATTPYDQQGLSKLKILTTLICQNQPEYGNISLPYQTICGLMVSNTKRFTRPSRIIADKMDNSHGRTKDKAGFVSSHLTVEELYCRSGNRVLPGALQRGLFTVVVNDNIDKNSSSSSAWNISYNPPISNCGEFRRASPEKKVL